MGLPERSQFVDIVAPVPRGNRMAFLVNAARADFGGDLNLEFKDLPPGVTVETLPMPANRSDVPVLFTAAPDAPLGRRAGRRHRPACRSEPEDRRPPAAAHVAGPRPEQHRRLEPIQPTGWPRPSTEEAPFTIEIVEPKVPLVRDGSMDLKVVATRKEGFTAPIASAHALQPAGRRLVGLDRDSRRQDRSRRSR